MNIRLPINIAAEIKTLVENGDFETAQIAVEQLLAKALKSRSNRSTGRFAYEEPEYKKKELEMEE